MITYDLQAQINNSWNQWRQRRHPVEPKTIRKKHYCVKCGNKGFRVKMDFLKNYHTQFQISCYNIDLYKCPRCGHLDKDWSRIEGRGSRGTNLGKLYGSK